MSSTPQFDVFAQIVALGNANAVQQQSWRLGSVLLIVAIIFAWRFLRPAAKRYIDPQRPHELPSWTPYFGHVLTYWRDAGEVVRQVRAYTQSWDPVTVVLAHRRMCMIVSKDDSEYIHKSALGNFDHEDAIERATCEFGLSKQGRKQIWSKRDGLSRKQSGDSRCSNTFGELINISRREMSALSKADGMPIELLKQMRALSAEDLLPSRAIISGNGNSQVVSLSRWVRTIVAQVSTEACFGSTMMKINPHLHDLVYDFDDRVILLLSHVPWPVSRRMWNILYEYQKALTKYLNTPRADREDSAHMWKQYETIMQREDVPTEDIAVIYSMMFWGMNTNVWKASFWCMCYAVSDPQLLAELREEVRPAVTSSSSASELAQQIRACPKLNSVFHETVRVAALTSSHRKSITEQTLPSGKTIAPGTDLLLLYREMLTDTRAYGSDALEFKWDRFLNNEQLGKGAGYRPFGGGIGHCPGRFLAQTESMAMVALLITRYDCDTMGAKIPDLDTKMPPVGMGGPVGDMVLRVTPRAT